MTLPDDLDPSLLARAIAAAGAERFGRSLDVRTQTGSTMDDARRAADEGAPEGHTILADVQRAGRGSRGRRWASPGGTDLYLSIVTRPQVELESLPPLTLAVGLGVAEAVESLCPNVRAEVKWPNDVQVGGRKVAGVLVESRAADGATAAAVIGIGLNVGRTQWPDELAGEATSLCEVAARGRPPNRAVALGALLAAVERWVDRFVAAGPAAIVPALEARLALRGRTVRCDDVVGRLAGVEPSGALRIDTPAGPATVLAGRLEPVAPAG
ncbi:MAG: biotin--[acetyl-CoA-carboxylase] ligase [Myxococcales bacterium]|nr:biotin--[acetyl-CoA-carboxylase] ligase [Myxococcales bacterium]